VFSAETGAPPASGHDVSGGVDPIASSQCIGEGCVILFEGEALPGKFPNGLAKKLPRFDLIEEFEEKSSEEDLFRIGAPFVNDTPNEKLADTI
jgi:hypothetical protein